MTIVHGEPAALNLAYSDRFRAHLHKIFSKRGVNFVYHDRIDDLKIHDGIVTTRKGVEIKTELLVCGFFPCFHFFYFHSMIVAVLNVNTCCSFPHEVQPRTLHGSSLPWVAQSHQTPVSSKSHLASNSPIIQISSQWVILWICLSRSRSLKRMRMLPSSLPTLRNTSWIRKRQR